MEYQGESYKVWSGTDTERTTWEYIFSGGIIARVYVKMRYLDLDGNWRDVKLFPKDFSTDDTINKTLPPNQVVEVYRDTTYNHAIVNYGYGGTELSRVSQSAAARQPIHIVQELIDRVPRATIKEDYT